MSEDNATPVKIPAQWRIRAWFPELDETTLDALKDFHEELLRFNSKLNLISRRTELEADQTHFADSILAAKALISHSTAGSIVDIGSGNGFPGLVLAILAPSKKLILLDKDSRKIEFLKHCIAKLGLSNASTLNSRIEDLKDGSVECGISRGFASVGKSLISARKAFKPGGEYFHMKGSSWVREVAEIPTQICSYWAPRLVSNYQLPSSSTHLSLVVTKRIG